VTSLAEIAVFTEDVAAVSAFYRRLLATDPVAEWPGGTLFAVGEGKLLVHERDATMTEGPPNEDHLALSVEDLDGTCSALVADGWSFLLEPRDYAWGRSAYLRDPGRPAGGARPEVSHDTRSAEP
jgi:catechol 2,3-dioxygenase-like lactoylglutathione lyase family enzyme